MYHLLTNEISKLDISNTPNPRQFELSREPVIMSQYSLSKIKTQYCNSQESKAVLSFKQPVPILGKCQKGVVVFKNTLAGR